LKQSDPDDQNDNEAYHASNIADERTLAWAYNLDSLPSEEFAAYNWPPSIYEAAQHVYPTSLPPRQPYVPAYNHSMSVEECWQPSSTAVFSHPDRSRYLKPLQVNSMNRMDSENFVTLSCPDFGPGSTTDDLTPSVSESANENEDVSSSIAKYVDQHTSLTDITDSSEATSQVCAVLSAWTSRHSPANMHREI
jgi:hypothetical protein